MQSPPDRSFPQEDPSSEWEGELPSGNGRQFLPVREVARRLWNPAPLPQPRIDPEMHDWSWPERTVEVVSFTLLSLEFWLSRGGWLREWLRLYLWLAVVLGLGAVLLVPPATALLKGAEEWSGLVAGIVENITEALLRLPPVVLGLATLLLAVKLFQRFWQERHRKRGRNDGSFDGYP